MYETFIDGPKSCEITPTKHKLYRYCPNCMKKHFSQWGGGDSANPENSPHLFNDNHTEYVGNDTVLETTLMGDGSIAFVSLMGNGYFCFKYGAFCKLRCASEWANKRLGAEQSLYPKDIKRKIIGEPSAC